MSELTYLKTEYNKNDKKAIIFIHGWKGNKNSFKTLPSLLNLKDVCWFFPQAPYKLDNEESYSWSIQNSSGEWAYRRPKALLEKFLKSHILNRFKPKDVYFIGFSQGATVCYEFILQLNYPWGGVFPIAGFIRNFDNGISINSNQKKTPIIIGHGEDDQIVPITSSEKIYSYLNKANNNVSFEKYKGGHKISLDYLKKIRILING